MTLFNLDLGNKRTKMLSYRTDKVFPSYFVEVSQYGHRGILNFAKKKKPTSNFSSDLDKGFTYVWGSDLDVDAIDVITDTIGFGIGRYKSRNFQLLVDFALAELAKDYKEVLNVSGILEVDVSTGLPTDDYMQQDIINLLVNIIKGDHTVIVDGETLTIRVNNLYLLPQPLGTLINEIADEDGNILDSPLTQADIGIVDIGGGTILIDSLRKMNLVENKRTQLEQGAYILYEAIQKELTTRGYIINVYEIEAIVREGSNNESYIWSPDGVQQIDISPIVMHHRLLFTRIIASSIKTAFKGFGRMQVLLVTGGASNLIIKENFIEELPVARFVNDGEKANIRGFRKHAIAGGAKM